MHARRQLDDFDETGHCRSINSLHSALYDAASETTSVADPARDFRVVGFSRLGKIGR